MDESHLYHFSEDPGITRFEPRPGRQLEGRPPGERLVWAIDEHHAPVYFFPRECPRIMLWPIEGSTEADIERWMRRPAGRTPRMLAHIESAWQERFRNCRLFRYTFPPGDFKSIHDHGVHVSRSSVEPVEVAPVGDLAAALEEADVELMVVGTLQPLADAWFSTLHFSGVRLRNATEWTSPV